MLFLKLLFRNAFRHKLRTFLTILGMAIAILAFGLLRTVVDAWYAGVEASSVNRLVVRNAISLFFPLPISYKDKIEGVDGVTEVSWGNWYGGYYKDEKNFFANFAIEPRTYLDMYPEYIIPAGEKALFLKERNAAVVGIKTAERFGWKTGDLVTLKGTIYPGQMDFLIAGIYRGRYNNTDETQFFFNWDYLNEALKKTNPLAADHAGFFLVEIANPDAAGFVANAIDNLFKNSLAETHTESERAFQMGFVTMTEAIVTAIRLVSIVVIFIILAVVANTMAMSVRERLGEYAVFKTLGFGVFHIAVLIFGESVVITGVGCALGVILTFPAADIFTYELGQYFPVFLVKHETVYLDMMVSLGVAAAAAIIPAYRAATVSIIAALRRIG